MIKKCLFPVAGYGTRFLPATKSMPKEMLPIVNKPLIEYAAEEAYAAGIRGLNFVTGRGKYAIPNHFDYSYELETEIAGSQKEENLKDIRRLMNGCTFSYTRQIQMKGLGHAILCGEPLIGDMPFAVILADDLCLVDDGDNVIGQMAKLYEKYRCSIVAIQEVPKDEVHQYGIVSGEIIDDGVLRVSDMIEKPKAEDAPSNLAVIGRYILTPDIFAILRNTQPGKNGEIQITDAIMQQARQGGVVAYKYKGRRFDCGSISGFIEATNYCYENIYKKKS
jgi:UTP--glucose-1-phosphate uridylyltransferase